MKRKYEPIQVYDECVEQMKNAGHIRMAEEWGDILDMPIPAEVIQTVVHIADGDKTPSMMA